MYIPQLNSLQALVTGSTSELNDRQANSLVYLFQSFGVPRQSLGEGCLIVNICFNIMPGTFNRFDLQLDDRQANSLVYLFQNFGVPRQSLGEGRVRRETGLTNKHTTRTQHKQIVLLVIFIFFILYSAPSTGSICSWTIVRSTRWATVSKALAYPGSP